MEVKGIPLDRGDKLLISCTESMCAVSVMIRKAELYRCLYNLINIAIVLITTMYYLEARISVNDCPLSICFEPINEKVVVLFGFPEYLASLSLMILAWNMVDIRYRFRLHIAPFNLQKNSFYAMSLIGVLCLIMEYWKFRNLPVLKNSYVKFEDLQLALALVYLSIFILWANFSFIKPSKFQKKNARKYVDFIGHVFITKNVEHISIVLDEISYSINEIVEFASEKDKEKLNAEEKLANTIIALISEKYICEIMVDKHPILFNEIFKLLVEKGKFNMSLGLFSINFVTSALDNKESFIYRENDEFLSNYLSTYQPICRGIYDNYKVISNYKWLLAPDIYYDNKDHKKWRAYFSLLSMSIKSYLNYDRESTHLDIAPNFLHFPKITVCSISKALRCIEPADILDYNHDSFKMIKELSNFFNSISRELVDTAFVNKKYYIHEFISQTLFEIITEASKINNFKSNLKIRRFIQKRLIWSELYCHLNSFSDQENNVLNLVNELIYNKIRENEEGPNVDAIEMLVYILFVLGLKHPDNEGPYVRAWRSLHVRVLTWCRENLSGILDEYPKIISEYFPENITYDKMVSELRYSYGENSTPVSFKLNSVTQNKK